ncbi:MAG: DUF362 domain-containing protein, partial [Planctomycetaceae bacterium]|nr:DUF362 domain-containing protein [Planctomycetaceae bacterium]
MHCDNRPYVKSSSCVGCGTCTKYCNEKAITVTNKKAKIDTKKCVGCGRCIGTCNFHAIDADVDSSSDMLNARMVEYTKAVVDGRPHFHISVINQVTAFCDCHGENDAPIVPDIGIFASFDPVALDKACIDAVNAAPGLPNTILDESKKIHKDANKNPDHLTDVHPTTDWRSQIAHAEKIGLGTGNYTLVAVK